jgi:hypothetical protein
VCSAATAGRAQGRLALNFVCVLKNKQLINWQFEFYFFQKKKFILWNVSAVFLQTIYRILHSNMFLALFFGSKTMVDRESSNLFCVI